MTAPRPQNVDVVVNGLLNHQSMILRIVTPFAVTVARGHKLLGAIVAPPLRNMLNSRDWTYPVSVDS